MSGINGLGGSGPVEAPTIAEVPVAEPPPEPPPAAPDAPPASQGADSSSPDVLGDLSFTNQLEQRLAQWGGGGPGGAVDGGESASGVTDVLQAAPRSPVAPPLDLIEKGGMVAYPGQKGDTVKQIQEALNAQGQTPPLDENGEYDAKTEAAVKAFQEKQGFPPTERDGRVGPDTLGRLIPNEKSVESDPRFKALDPSTQAEVKARLKDAGGDYAARANIGALATNEGFGKLPPTSRWEMIRTLARAPGDRALGDELRGLAGSEKFRALDPGVQFGALGQMKANATDPAARANIASLATDDGFGKVSPGAQRSMIDVLGKAPADPALAADLRALAGSTSFQGLDPAIQEHGVQQIGNQDPADPAARGTLTKLMSMPGFAKLDGKSQERLLTQVGGSKDNLISVPSRDALDKLMNGWTPGDNADTQKSNLEGFLKDQNWDDWHTWKGAWDGRTSKPDSVKGPDPVPAGKFDTDPNVEGEKHTLKYGDKEIPVFIPKGSPPDTLDKIKANLEALSKAERDVITEIKVEPKGHPTDPNAAFDAAGDTGVVRAFPGGLAMTPVDRQKSAMVHEAAHLIDRRMSKADGPKWGAAWQQAMKDDVLVHSQYGKDKFRKEGSDADDFADAYLLYRISKGTPQADEYKRMFPNRWKLMEEIERRSNAGEL